jgi:hypothetical protein
MPSTMWPRAQGHRFLNLCPILLKNSISKMWGVSYPPITNLFNPSSPLCWSPKFFLCHNFIMALPHLFVGVIAGLQPLNPTSSPAEKLVPHWHLPAPGALTAADVGLLVPHLLIVVQHTIAHPPLVCYTM